MILVLNRFRINIDQWVQGLPQKALEKAYQSAITIKSIEGNYFQGNKISPQNVGGKSVYDYYKSAVDRELATINFNLTQLRVSHFLNVGTNASEAEEVLEKLRFIETVIAKYRNLSELDFLEQASPSLTQEKHLSTASSESPTSDTPKLLEELEENIAKNLPFRRRKFTPEYEQEVIQELRQLREKRKIAWRTFALLLVIPLLVQVITKNVIFTPLIDYWKVNNVELEKIQISEEVGEKALEEYRKHRDILEIGQLLNPTRYTGVEIENKLREKAKELIIEAGYRSRRGLINILADVTALLTFAGLVYFRQRQCRIAISFLSDNFLGLNVVTQVFIFILLTDMFVGFHSAEGWDVFLTKAGEHFGFSENRVFNGLFIASIPVILDSTFKLLIFNYFTRKAPTAVAILEKMNQ